MVKVFLYRTTFKIVIDIVDLNKSDRLTTKTLLTAIMIMTCVSLVGKAVAQKNWVDSIRFSVKDIYQGLRLFIPEADSLIQKRIHDPQYIDTTRVKKIMNLKSTLPDFTIEKPSLRFGGGYISYNGIYRSTIDTPFSEKDIFQHMVTARLDFTVKENFPLTLTYFQRESNSRYFRDYRDFKVEFNVGEFQRLREQKFRNYIAALTEQIRNPLTRPTLDYVNSELLGFDELLNHYSVVNKHIASRITARTGGLSDTTGRSKDSVITEAKQFLTFYDSLKIKQKKLQGFRDSLQKEFVNTEKQILQLKQLLSFNSSSEDQKERLNELLREQKVDHKIIHKLYGTVASVRKFAVGRVSPNYTDLTLKNLNVRGIDFEYSRKLYFALTAGWIDFRARDFFYNGSQKKPQFIYASRIGYGKKEGSHIYFTGFRGKKQLLSSSSTNKTFDVYGLSFESQIFIAKNHHITTEISQSVAPELVSLSGGTEKPNFDLKDEKNKAYSLRLNSLFARIGLKLEGFYQYRGINYQSFTSYYSNAVLNSWHMKVSQYLFKRRLSIKVSIAKNAFENPNLLTRYNGNTVFENVTIAYRNQKWPSLSFGYMPSSQLSDVGGILYENYFQTLNFTVSHGYKLGVARAHSVLSYNQFYNDSKDSGFVYFNAKNLFFNQSLQFLSYAANINVAQSTNSTYTLTTLDGGINAKVFKNSQVGIGVKISQLNNQDLKLGVYGSERILIPKLGEISLSIEKSYLPGFDGNLVKNDLYTIGYTRYFK
jgi:hypothetical protein